MTDLKRHIRDVPNFPQPGILFRDIAPLLRHNLNDAVEAMSGLLGARDWEDIDAIAGIESRGFIFGSALALRHQKGFVPIRKQGKLPPPVVCAPYQLEYGTGVLEMQPGTGKLLLVDDVLATGGTLQAAANLATLAGYQVRRLMVLIDLQLPMDTRGERRPVLSVIQY